MDTPATLTVGELVERLRLADPELPIVLGVNGTPYRVIDNYIVPEGRCELVVMQENDAS